MTGIEGMSREFETEMERQSGEIVVGRVWEVKDWR